MTDNSEALLPCPFCGSANIDPAGWASTETSGPACDDCGASAGSTLKPQAENIAAWNTRPSSPAATIEICPACNGCGFQNPQASTEACGVCNGSGGVSPASDGDAVENRHE